MPPSACFLLNTLMGETVASGPIRALRAGSSLGVVHAFFVRTADNPVGHDSGAGAALLEEGENLLTDGEILAYVLIAISEPTLENIGVVTFSEENTHHYLGSQFLIGAIKSQNGYWVASKNQIRNSCLPTSGRSSFCGIPSFLY